MKRKLLLMLLMCTLLLLVGCGSSEDKQDKTAADPVPAKQEEKEKTVDPPSDGSDFGNGKFYLENESGSTKDIERVIIFADDSVEKMLQLGYKAEDFNGKHLTFIYVDSELRHKEQLGDYTVSSIVLNKQSDFKVGVHQVVVKQFDNDKEDGNLILRKTVEYEVKPK